MQQPNTERPLENDSIPKSEMEVLKRAVFGNQKPGKTPINEVIPSGHLEEEQIEAQQIYHDMYVELDQLKNFLGLEKQELSTKEKILNKMNFLSHVSKAEQGFGLETLITRRTQQFEAMKQRTETDAKQSTIEELKEMVAGSEGESLGNDLRSPSFEGDMK